MSETRFDKLFGVGSGTGSRPVAGNAGARWIDTTGPTESYDDGSAWHTIPSGGSPSYTWTAKTANYTLVAGDFIAADATSGALTMTLPTAAGVTTLLAVMKKDSSANKVTIGTTSAQTIDGASSKVLSIQGDVIVFASDGSNWQMVAQHRSPVLQLDYNAASDITTTSGTAISATTWTDCGVNQSFTVDDAASLVMIEVGGFVLLGNATGGNRLASRLVIDSAGTPINSNVGGGNMNGTGNYTNALAGTSPVWLTGLAAGSHTVKLQLFIQNAGTFICSPSSLPNYDSLKIRVVEFKRG